MKNKKYFLSFLLLLALQSNTAFGQSLNIVESSGNTSSHTLAGLNSIVFKSGNIIVYETGCQALFYNEAFTNQLNFGNSNPVNGISEVEVNGTVSVFPNPVTTTLTIKHTKSSATILRVLDVRGAEVIKQKTTEKETSIDVSNLTSGIYILFIDNQALKFIKQ